MVVWQAWVASLCLLALGDMVQTPGWPLAAAAWLWVVDAGLPGAWLPVAWLPVAWLPLAWLPVAWLPVPAGWVPEAWLHLVLVVFWAACAQMGFAPKAVGLVSPWPWWPSWLVSPWPWWPSWPLVSPWGFAWPLVSPWGFGWPLECPWPLAFLGVKLGHGLEVCWGMGKVAGSHHLAALLGWLDWVALSWQPASCTGETCIT